jgi:diguanylate cyclase
MTASTAPRSSPLTAAETALLAAQQAFVEQRAPQAAAQAEIAFAALTHPKDAPQRRRAGLIAMEASYRIGAAARVVELSAEVLPLLRAAGRSSELVDMLRLVSMCAAETRQLPEALQTAQEAHRLATELGDAASLSKASNTLASFFDRAGDYWQAERLFLDALALARQQAEAHPLFIALNNLAATLMGMFRLQADALPLDQAREPLRRARAVADEALALARERQIPFPLVCALGNLAEVLIGLGLADEAESPLTQAEALVRQHGFEAQRLRLCHSRGEWLMLRGRAAEAVPLLQGALAEAGTGPAEDYARLLLHRSLAQALAASGRGSPAYEQLQAYLRQERSRTLTQLQAQSALFVTRMEAEQLRSEAQRQRARAQTLEAQAHLDPLTGLGNRREMEHRWPLLLTAARATHQQLAVAMIDIDHFKRINDSHGHALGDQVLVELAVLLKRHTRNDDLVVRLGGEEFLVVLSDTGAERAAEICERLRQQIAAHDWGRLAAGLAVTASLGVSISPPLDDEALALRADAALYRAKAAGRNRVEFG